MVDQVKHVLDWRYILLFERLELCKSNILEILNDTVFLNINELLNIGEIWRIGISQWLQWETSILSCEKLMGEWLCLNWSYIQSIDYELVSWRLRQGSICYPQKGCYYMPNEIWRMYLTTGAKNYIEAYLHYKWNLQYEIMFWIDLNIIDISIVKH